MTIPATFPRRIMRLALNPICAAAAAAACLLCQTALAQDRSPSPAQTAARPEPAAQTAQLLYPDVLANYQALAAKYVDINEALGNEERAWKESRAFMLRELELLENEKAALSGQIEENQKDLARNETDRLGMLRDKDAKTARLDEFAAAADQAAAKLAVWQTILPESLGAAVCGPLFARLGRLRSLPVPERLELVCSIYAEIAKILNGVHLTREILDVGSDGHRREYDVLYLGLSAAYALSPDGKTAALAFPAPDGKWKWGPDQSIARAVRRAMRLYRHESKAAFTELPLQNLAAAKKEDDDE